MCLDFSHIFIHPQVTTFDFYRRKDVPHSRRVSTSFIEWMSWTSQANQVNSVTKKHLNLKDVPQQTDDDLSTWLSWGAWDDVKALVISVNNPWWFKDETTWAEPGFFFPFQITPNLSKYLSRTVCRFLLLSSLFKYDLSF